jgi:heme/copper-type cytochrome/quinol oxidase subunit 3
VRFESQDSHFQPASGNLLVPSNMMHVQERQYEFGRHLQKPGAFAVVFFLVAVVVLSVALGTAWLAGSLTPPAVISNRIAVIASFIVSTGLLGSGSWQLVRASGFVRLERRQEFRRCLVLALAAGSTFVSVQAYGLQSLITQHSVDIATGIKHAAFAFILLHAIHVVVALLFVVFVYLRALTDHYDHEYSWGVSFCGWFWHGLGIVWIAILAVFTVAGTAALAR